MRAGALALALAALTVLPVACGTSPPASAPSVATHSPVVTDAVSPSAPAAPFSPSPVPPPTSQPPVDPGSLPQTAASPTAVSPLWWHKVAVLWEAIRTGDPGPALAAFFPLSAYRQVKAISDPAADWQDRLVHLYDLDILAAHAWLGPHAQQARLIGVDVPVGGSWVQPGQEYNRLSYWRVYGTRVKVAVDGRERSFGIASLISWRGEWYVVHLGPITRAQPVGQVFDPLG